MTDTSTGANAPAGASPPREKPGFSFGAFAIGFLVMLVLRGGVQAYVQITMASAKAATEQVDVKLPEEVQAEEARAKLATLEAAVPPDQPAIDAQRKTVDDLTAKATEKRLAKAGEQFGNVAGKGLGIIVAYLVMAPFCYFLGGVIVAWRSTGRTIIEPALAAVLVVVAMTGWEAFQMASGALNVPCLACSGIMSFMFALIGSFAGEKIQSSAG